MKLLEPGRIGSMTVRNRVFMAPMGTTSEPDGSLHDRSIRYYEERAKGGFGFIITGANQVNTKYEQKACNILGSERSLNQLGFLARRVHHNGAKLVVQLTPGLGRMQLPFAADVAPKAASAVESFWFPGLMCVPLTVEEIQDLVQSMARGAAMAKRSGADAVEMHGYGGYLMDQFSSSKWNKREDEYGGDLAGRLKFPLEVIAAVREAVGPDFPILYKFTPYHGVEGGRKVPEGIEMAKMLEAAGVDALHVDMGCYEAWYKAIDTVYQEAPTQAWLADEIRKHVSVPVLTQGKLQDPNLAEKVLQDGMADFVGLAHGALADPNWVNKVRRGQGYDVVPCIGCNECLFAGFSGNHYQCAVNPQCYAEEYFPVTPALEKKRVLVLGGGPGGMEAAMIAAERGHEVELWEKGARLGGTLLAAGGPVFKKDVLDYANYMINKTYRSDITVRTMKNASAEEIKAANFDKVIMATGAHHTVPPIPGIDGTKVVMANDVLTGQAKFGKKVAILGAGLVGAEAAAHCKTEGAEEVTVLEMLPEPLMTVEHCRNNEQALNQLLEDTEVKFITSAKVTNFGEDAITYEQDGETKVLAADTYIIASGYTPNDSLYDQLIADVDVSMVGDVAGPDSILTAVHGGFHIARAL